MSNASVEVAEYVKALARVQSEVLQNLPDLGSSLASILRRVRAGQLPKDGELANGIEYSVHGNGCLFVSVDGHEVDVDFLANGTPVFDAWRIERFSLSRGVAPVSTAEELTRECRLMVSSGTLEEASGGWFAVKSEGVAADQLIGRGQG
ncbi:DUF6896 domain-containing protein [Streptomyces sp. NPDC002476]|uniref:DUF6896 domain-containing protein n=1 Tax=Streptomyces sp. NPDC002476 TaxID=3364648 RepID=UPI0036BDE3AB